MIASLRHSKLRQNSEQLRSPCMGWPPPRRVYGSYPARSSGAGLASSPLVIQGNDHHWRSTLRPRAATPRLLRTHASPQPPPPPHQCHRCLQAALPPWRQRRSPVVVFSTPSCLATWLHVRPAHKSLVPITRECTQFPLDDRSQAGMEQRGGGAMLAPTRLAMEQWACMGAHRYAPRSGQVECELVLRRYRAAGRAPPRHHAAAAAAAAVLSGAAPGTLGPNLALTTWLPCGPRAPRRRGRPPWTATKTQWGAWARSGCLALIGVYVRACDGAPG